MAQLKNPEGAPKILRIGIIQNGKIVEERLVRKRESVTIGQSTRNTFVVPASNALPRTFTIFELTPAGYAINFSDMMDGRVSLGDQVVALPALRQGKAQKKGELWHLLLPDKSRGKVVIGDVTVLFQFVTPPPVQPRPQLPPSVRSSLMQNLDWMLVAVVAASFIAHFGFVIYLRNIDWPRKPDIEEIPDRFVQMIVPKKVEEPKPVVAQKEDDKKDDEEKKDAKKEHAESKAKAPKPPRDPEAEARAAAERRARLAADVQKMGVLKILGAKGENGSVADLVKGGDVSGDADKVFAQVGGVGVAGAGAGGLRSAKGAGGTGSLRGGGSLRASGPGEVGTGERGGERAVKAIVKDSAPQDVDGSLDPSVIAKEIRSRLGAIKACYEAGLKRNPNIGGKVQLRFEISSVGKVTSAEIENDTMHDDEVASCITSRVKTWRFPAPAGGSVQFSYPFIFQASK
ncbi:MAG TPA: AgmX/PglI C-terminal domain-containing protein [Polyangia bacterium]|nr:AgmX/PglI C-terminal domain-containing protein [Polyangia bacterium]